MATRKSSSAPGAKTRRQFHQSVAFLAAAPLLGPLEASAAQEKPADATQALTEVARLRYGKHLSEEQLKAVQRSLERQARNAEALGKIKLKNSDEPDFIVSADVP